MQEFRTWRGRSCSRRQSDQRNTIIQRLSKNRSFLFGWQFRVVLSTLSSACAAAQRRVFRITRLSLVFTMELCTFDSIRETKKFAEFGQTSSRRAPTHAHAKYLHMSVMNKKNNKALQFVILEWWWTCGWTYDNRTTEILRYVWPWHTVLSAKSRENFDNPVFRVIRWLNSTGILRISGFGAP